MSNPLRDTLALYLIATSAVILTLYGGIDLAGMFNAILVRW